MSKHLIKIDNPQHCAISVAHAGLDNQYCEAGDVVAIHWQPSSGWGLQEAHYTDEDGNVVSIDLSVREFTMPAKAIVISGTAKRFVIDDWTDGQPDSLTISQQIEQLKNSLPYNLIIELPDDVSVDDTLSNDCFKQGSIDEFIQKGRNLSPINCMIYYSNYYYAISMFVFTNDTCNFITEANGNNRGSTLEITIDKDNKVTYLYFDEI